MTKLLRPRSVHGVKRTLLALLACAATGLAACGEKSEPPVATAASTTTPATVAKYPLTYRKSGGIAGINEGLLITKQGQAGLRIGYMPEVSTSKFELTAGERRRLGRLSLPRI